MTQSNIIHSSSVEMTKTNKNDETFIKTKLKRRERQRTSPQHVSIIIQFYVFYSIVVVRVFIAVECETNTHSMEIDLPTANPITTQVWMNRVLTECSVFVFVGVRATYGSQAYAGASARIIWTGRKFVVKRPKHGIVQVTTCCVCIAIDVRCLRNKYIDARERRNDNFLFGKTIWISVSNCHFRQQTTEGKRQNANSFRNR